MIGLGGRAAIRDMRSGATTRFELAIREAEAPKFSPDGAFFASGSQFGTAKIWETHTRREVAAFTNATGDVGSIVFSPDSSRIATSSLGESEAVRLWDFASLQLLLTLQAKGSYFRQAAFSPDGNIVGAINLAGTLHLWRAPPMQEIEATEKLAANQHARP
jgi:WD40 repeat protein